MMQHSIYAADFDFVNEGFENKKHVKPNLVKDSYFEGRSDSINKKLNKVFVSTKREDISIYKGNSIPSPFSQIIPVVSLGMVLLAVIFGLVAIYEGVFFLLIPIGFTFIAFGMVLFVSVHIRMRVKNTWKGIP